MAKNFFVVSISCGIKLTYNGIETAPMGLQNGSQMTPNIENMQGKYSFCASKSPKYSKYARNIKVLRLLKLPKCRQIPSPNFSIF